MIPTPHELVAELRRGKFIRLADETGWSLACDPGHSEAIDYLLAVRQDLVPSPLPTILISDSGQLNLYARPIPDVAWDLIDLAEEPLTVLLNGGVNLPAVFKAQVPVRKTLSVLIRKLIGTFDRGILILPFEDTQWPIGLAEPPLSYGVLPGTIRVPRIMALGSKGEVVFLRK